MEKQEQAARYFLDGYNCTQSVLLSYQEELQLDREALLKMGASFGGGMGRLRQVCGTVSGMFMVLGLLYGYTEPKDLEGKTKHYERVQALAERFEQRNGSIVCREILGLRQKKDPPKPSERTAEYYKKRPCAKMVYDAVEILEEFRKELEAEDKK